MNFETVDELADVLADWCGVYGSCNSNGETGCTLDPDKPFCCRMGFLDAIGHRIRESVANDAAVARVRSHKRLQSQPEGAAVTSAVR